MKAGADRVLTIGTRFLACHITTPSALGARPRNQKDGDPGPLPV